MSSWAAGAIHFLSHERWASVHICSALPTISVDVFAEPADGKSPYSVPLLCIFGSNRESHEMAIPLTQVAPIDCGLPLAFPEVGWTIR